jgi:four helix bundle protein
MSNYGAIKNFTDLEAWKLARKVRQAVYKIVKTLPPEEKYGLGLQMRKSSISSTANIAEGFGRFHYQENIRFCRISRGSLYETMDHLITCYDEQYITKEQFKGIFALSKQAAKVLNGYIRWLKKQKSSNEN